MFADDTKMFKGITNDADRILLQSDIENLVKWSIKWKLPFNSTKCKIMTLGHNQVTSNYTMSYTESTVTDILIDNELTFTEHINIWSRRKLMELWQWLEDRLFALITNVSICCISIWWDYIWNMVSLPGFRIKWRVLKQLKKFRKEPPNKSSS